MSESETGTACLKLIQIYLLLTECQELSLMSCHFDREWERMFVKVCQIAKKASTMRGGGKRREVRREGQGVCVNKGDGKGMEGRRSKGEEHSSCNREKTKDGVL